ncbi:hypothetical protein [Phyllobacterium sp. P5_D12]
MGSAPIATPGLFRPGTAAISCRDHVHQLPAMAGLPEGWTFAFRKSLSGACHWDKKHIVGPAHAHLHAVPMLLSLGHPEY